VLVAGVAVPAGVGGLDLEEHLDMAEIELDLDLVLLALHERRLTPSRRSASPFGRASISVPALIGTGGSAT
jgi:hypothetical protein